MKNIQSQGTQVAPQPAVNFTGGGVSVTTDANGRVNNISIPGGAVVLNQVSGTSPPIAAGCGVIATAGNVTLANSAALADGLLISGLALTAGIASASVQMVSSGLVDPAVISLGAGLACAVGLDTNGKPVRVTDAACVSGLKYLGVCDANGAIYVSPRVAQFYDVTDFGAVADADGTHGTGTDNTTSIQKALDAAGAVGGIVYVPVGMFRTTAKLTGSLSTTFRGAGRRKSAIVGDHFDFVYEIAGTLNGSTIGDVRLESLRFTSATQTVGAVTGATNASPIEITLANHGLSTGAFVNIAGVGGNTAANRAWQITKTGTNTFTLNGSTGNGSYTSSTGTVTRVALAGVHDIACGDNTHSAIQGDNVFFGRIVEQAECFSSYDFIGVGLFACDYFPNGADVTPGAEGGFTNVIFCVNSQWNGGAYGLCDDGGADHVFVSCNANGNTVRGMRLAGLEFGAFIGGDQETASTELAGTSLLTGNGGVSTCTRVRFEAITWSTGSMHPILADGGGATFVDCEFAGATPYIYGASAMNHLDVRQPYYGTYPSLSDLVDGMPGHGNVMATGGADTVQVTQGTAAPSSGAWLTGAIVWNTTPTAGGNIGWVCTSGGVPGTWKTFGVIAS